MMPERVCSKCTARQKAEWGCDAKQDENGVWTNKAFLPLEVDGKESWACPRRPIKDDPDLFQEIMGLYSLYSEGVLADEGSIMSQSAKYLTIMRLVSATVAECHAEQIERARSGQRE